MDVTLPFYLAGAGAVILTGISKSGFAGGLGVLAVPLMSFYIAPQLAVSVLIPILVAMDILVAWRFRATWNKAIVAMLLPGMAVGLALGALVFQWLSADLIKVAVGLLAVLFVAQFLFGAYLKRPVTKPSRVTVFVLGSLSGFASFVAHAGGPPIKGVLLRQGLEKSVFVGTNTMFFFVMNSTKLVTYAAMGELTFDSLRLSLYLAPMLFVGIGIGLLMHRFISQTLFTRIAYAFLLFAGLKLVWDGRAIFLA
jgi:uncharacterized protein